jgi:hypothetical protein
MNIYIDGPSCMEDRDDGEKCRHMLDEDLKRTYLLSDLGIDRIILKCILKKRCLITWTGLSWHMMGSSDGPSVTMKLQVP